MKLFYETSSIFELDNIKTKQFCKTSSSFARGNVKNEANLRDFLNFRSWQQQKWSNSARRPSKMESWVQSWRPRTNVFRFVFFRTTYLTYCACHEKLVPGHTKFCTYHAKSSQQSWRSDAPKRNPSGNQRPPNISDEHVSCTAPATQNASLQIVCKCPTPTIVFGNATQPSRFAHFWQGAESLAPATQNHIWTSKSGPSMWCSWIFLNVFNMLTWKFCFAPQRRAIWQLLNSQKCF